MFETRQASGTQSPRGPSGHGVGHRVGRLAAAIGATFVLFVTSAAVLATPAWATAPSAPTGVSGVAGDGAVTVSWTASSAGSNGPVTSYTVTALSGGSATANVCTTDNGSTVTCTFNGGNSALTNNADYTFTVVATDGTEDSDPSTPSATVHTMTHPDSPTISSTAIPGDGSATVSWTAPSDNGGSTISSYTVTSSPGTKTCISNDAPPDLFCTVHDLTNGTPYTFTVTATNAAGTSDASGATDAATPFGNPAAPTIVSAAPNNTGDVVVTWSPPSNNGGKDVTGYQAYESSDAGASIGTAVCTTDPIVVPLPTTCTVTGLTTGTSYSIYVHASNDDGNTYGAPSGSLSATPRVVPDAPAITSLTPGAVSIDVAFDPPASNGGNTITNYVVTTTHASDAPAQFSCGGTTSPCHVTGLTNGLAYSATIQAVNAAGRSSASDPAGPVTPAGPPGAPGSVTATPGNESVDVGWTESLYHDNIDYTGFTVTTYLHNARSGATTDCALDNPCTITGLTNGMAYDFTVIATTAGGDSSESQAATATPRTVPDAPTITAVTAGDSAVTVEFDPPTSDGGNAIDHYMVYPYAGAPYTSAGTGNSCSDSPCSILGLTNGTNYKFTVVAVNDAGGSVESDKSGVATPRTVPGPPTITSAVLGNSSVDITWTAPTNDGGSAILGYKVRCTSSDSPTSSRWDGHDFVRHFVVPLTAGHTYSCVAIAVNVAGDGTLSDPSAVNANAKPGAPSAVTITPGNGNFTETWSAPLLVGPSEPTTYELTCTYLNGQGVQTAVSFSNPVWSSLTNPPSGAKTKTKNGLTNGTAYTCKLRGHNAIGWGPYVTKTVTPRTAPGAPTGVSAVPFSARATVNWTAPTNNGGSAITGYVVTCTASSHPTITATAGSAASTVSVGGLVNNVAYQCVVAAKNIAGTGTASSPVSVTPIPLPGQPTMISVTAGSQRAIVAFSAATGPVVNYTATCKSSAALATTPVTQDGSSSTITVTGLTAGKQYSCAVRANNASGTGAASTSRLVTPTA
ncbi:MAG: fibronectin type III domain-containing protein [Actinomycetes bacterium]